MKESASIVHGLASATAVASLLAATVVIVLGFIARERMSKSSRVRRGQEGGQEGGQEDGQAAGEGMRAALFGGLAAVLGHGVGSAMNGKWTASYTALGVLIYATALQFLTTTLIWRGWGAKGRGRAVAVAALLVLVGSAAGAYTG